LRLSEIPGCTTFVFSVGPINVNAEEYDNVADYIESGAISVVPGSSKTESKYHPPSDTFYTRKTDPPLNWEVRSNILHECTHAISDINYVKVTRMMDEAAAYLAQLAYVSLINPSYDKPPIGPPLNNLVRQCMDLVAKYHLGESAGQGVQILQSDISDLAHAVHAIPDYHVIPENEMLAADGVSLSDNQAEKFWRLRAQKVMNEILDNRIRQDIEEMLTTKSALRLARELCHRRRSIAQPLPIVPVWRGEPEKNDVAKVIPDLSLHRSKQRDALLAENV
jgi:hypothetical protein